MEIYYIQKTYITYLKASLLRQNTTGLSISAIRFIISYRFSNSSFTRCSSSFTSLCSAGQGRSDCGTDMMNRSRNPLPLFIIASINAIDLTCVAPKNKLTLKLFITLLIINFKNLVLSFLNPAFLIIAIIISHILRTLTKSLLKFFF